MRTQSMLITVGLLLLLVAQGNAQDSFPLAVADGKFIQDVLKLREEHATYAEERPRVLTDLAALYESTPEGPQRVVIADVMLDLGGTQLLKQRDDWIAKLALEVGSGAITKALPDHEIRTVTYEAFVKSWFAHRALARGQDVQAGHRLSSIQREYRQLQGGEGPVVDRALLMLKQWSTVSEYEAATWVLVEEFKHDDSRQLILNALDDFLSGPMPEWDPPPFERAHTAVSIYLTLVAALGDGHFSSSVECLASSGSEFVRSKAAGTLRWLHAGVPLPVTYLPLLQHYDSPATDHPPTRFVEKH